MAWGLRAGAPLRGGGGRRRRYFFEPWPELRDLLKLKPLTTAIRVASIAWSCASEFSEAIAGGVVVVGVVSIKALPSVPPRKSPGVAAVVPKPSTRVVTTWKKTEACPCDWCVPLIAATAKQAMETLNVGKTPVLEARAKLRAVSHYQPTSRNGGRVFAIAPSDVKRVFVEENLLNLAYETQSASGQSDPKAPAHNVNKVRSTDVRNFLRHELESAYDIMEGRSREQPPILADVPYIEDLTDKVYSRKFEGPKGAEVDSDKDENAFYFMYKTFNEMLPGALRFRSIGVLSWAIAVEAGLLNRQLQ